MINKIGTVIERYTEQEYQGVGQYSVFAEHILINHDFPPHTHSFTEAFIILAGTAIHRVGDYTYPLRAGNVCVLKGDARHGFEQVDHLEMMNLMYDPRIFINTGNELRTIPGFEPLFILEPEIKAVSNYPYMLTLEQQDLSYLTGIVDFMEAQLKSGNAHLGVTLKMSFLAIVSFLSVKYNCSESMSEKMQLIARAIRFLSEHFHEQITITDIAKELSVSQRYLDRLFIQYYQCSPVSYLTRFRLRHALTLLSCGEMPISRIAEKCGFTDPSYFSRVFKQVYGTTPRLAANLIQF